jgi:hypothetical protein
MQMISDICLLSHNNAGFHSDRTSREDSGIDEDVVAWINSVLFAFLSPKAFIARRNCPERPSYLFSKKIVKLVLLYEYETWKSPTPSPQTYKGISIDVYATFSAECGRWSEWTTNQLFMEVTQQERVVTHVKIQTFSYNAQDIPATTWQRTVKNELT